MVQLNQKFNHTYFSRNFFIFLTGFFPFIIKNAPAIFLYFTYFEVLTERFLLGSALHCAMCIQIWFELHSSHTDSYNIWFNIFLMNKSCVLTWNEKDRRKTGISLIQSINFDTYISGVWTNTAQYFSYQHMHTYNNIRITISKKENA